jgi:divalent metal cation (Fe/Co/Zn/Cd) transporter
MEQPTAGESLWQTIRDSKDPTVFTVFLEDSAALVGIVLAFCVLLGQVFHNPYFDPIASVMIAVLLAGVAVLLGRESGALLLGERADPDQIKALREIIVSDASVERVGDLLTMHLGPEQVLLAAEIKFRHGMNVEELEGTIDRLEERIRKNNPTIQKIFLGADSLRPSQPSTRAA